MFYADTAFLLFIEYTPATMRWEVSLIGFQLNTMNHIANNDNYIYWPLDYNKMHHSTDGIENAAKLCQPIGIRE